MSFGELPQLRRRLAVLCSVVAAATATTALAANPAGAAGGDYVALGDSYAAGSLVLPADSSSPLCARSLVNYPRLTARTVGLSLTDVTCGGATTDHMTTSQYPGVGPQFDALRADTEIVTLGIGGNDNLLFLGAIASCGALGLASPLTILDVGAPCRDLLGATHNASADAIKDKISANVRGIQAHSPDAQVFVVGYPDLLPQRGRCYPSLPLTSGDVAFLDQLNRRLNRSVQAAAAENGVTYVDLYTPSVGHDLCKRPSVRWVEPLVPAQITAPVHPNATGLAAAARTVTAAMVAAGI